MKNQNFNPVSHLDVEISTQAKRIVPNGQAPTVELKNPKPNEDAVHINQQLSDLHARHGFLTPELVLRDAYNPHSPLRSLFEWDDSLAAHRYRIIQAQKIINRLRIIFPNEPEKVIKTRVVTTAKTFANEKVETLDPEQQKINRNRDALNTLEKFVDRFLGHKNFDLVQHEMQSIKQILDNGKQKLEIREQNLNPKAA